MLWSISIYQEQKKTKRQSLDLFRSVYTYISIFKIPEIVFLASSASICFTSVPCFKASEFVAGFSGHQSGLQSQAKASNTIREQPDTLKFKTDSSAEIPKMQRLSFKLFP